MNNVPETAEAFIERKRAEFLSKRKVTCKDIGRKGRFHFHKEACTFMPQTNLANDKVFVVERLKIESTDGELAYDNMKRGDIEYRIGYYIVGKIGKRAGKWTWGQYCPLIPKEDLDKLLAKARQDGTILRA